MRYRLGGEVRELENASQLDIQITDTSETEESIDIDTGHQINIEGRPACCRKATAQGLVDCAACLNDAWSAFRDSVDPEDRNAAEWVLNAVHRAGEVGIRKADIVVKLFRDLFYVLKNNQFPRHWISLANQN